MSEEEMDVRIQQMAQQIQEDEDARIIEHIEQLQRNGTRYPVTRIPYVTRLVPPYGLGEACRLNAKCTIDEVINLRDNREHRFAHSYYIDWESRRRRVEVVRSRGWTKRNSRRLWAESLDRGDDPEEFLAYAVTGTPPEDDYQEWENERG